MRTVRPAAVAATRCQYERSLSGKGVSVQMEVSVQGGLCLPTSPQWTEWQMLLKTLPSLAVSKNSIVQILKILLNSIR